eukprot:3686475-Prymnesium_polylepis.1
MVWPDVDVPLQAADFNQRRRRLYGQSDVAADARCVASDGDVVRHVCLCGERQPRVERLAAFLAESIAVARHLLELVEALQLPAARNVEDGQVGVEADSRLAAAGGEDEHQRLQHGEAHPDRVAHAGEARVGALRRAIDRVGRRSSL